MRGDLYDAEGRLVGRKGGFSQGDFLGKALAADARARGGGPAVREEGAEPAPEYGNPSNYTTNAQGQRVEVSAGDQLKYLQGMQQMGPSPQSWARSGAAAGPVNLQSLIATNPNVYQNQHDAAMQMRALQGDQPGMYQGRVTVQGLNGPVQYHQNSVTGLVEPVAGSLDAISVQNAKVPSVNVNR